MCMACPAAGGVGIPTPTQQTNVQEYTMRKTLRTRMSEIECDVDRGARRWNAVR